MATRRKILDYGQSIQNCCNFIVFDASVGRNVNFRIVPLVYTLMSKKSKELSQRLFQEMNELAKKNGFELQPDFVLTDFEKGSIKCNKVRIFKHLEQRTSISFRAMCI